MKKLILNTIFCLSAIPVAAATDVATLWKAMPDSIIPYFNAALRTEMVDMYGIDKKSVSKNILGGECRIVSMAENAMELRINNATRLTIATYQKTDSTQIVCMIKSFGSPVAESSVAFYSTAWEKIESRFGLPDFCNAEAAVKALTHRPDTMSEQRYAEIVKKIEPAMVAADVNEDFDIEFTIACPLLTKEEKSELEAVENKKSFKWNGETFK